jgi:hypothetical protein
MKNTKHLRSLPVLAICRFNCLMPAHQTQAKKPTDKQATYSTFLQKHLQV